MKKKLKISRKTKSKAYQFIKSLMSDGVEGPNIHSLVSAISDNVNKEVGGEILVDLIKNAKDENGDINHETYWFGPISVQYYNWIIKSWAKYCENTELRGIFRFGDEKDWEEWRVSGKGNGQNKCTKEELKTKMGSSMTQICCFEWWADSVTSLDVLQHLSDLYDDIDEQMKKEAEDTK